MSKLTDWLDDRTGIRALLRAVLFEHIPGGARWRYVWGSTLAFAIFSQFVTGLVLSAAYSANALGAWESVFYIQHVMAGGWVLRGVHHYMAQVTIVLLSLHLMQVLIDGAYRAPREVNFWFGLILLFLILGLSLTGYLLPWDQKGYWATKVATSIASMTPVVGPSIQQLLVGGPDYGHYTLTRFFALHAGLLPALVGLVLMGHVYLFRRHGVTVPESVAKKNEPDAMFWPEQVLKDGVATLVVLAVVLGLTIWTGGAHLGAPADPTGPYAAARPDWYFMFLFQWLKYFPTGWEVVGAQVIPGLLIGLVAAMPLIGRWRLGHRFNIGVAVSLFIGVGFLTWQGFAADRADDVFLAAREAAEAEARRVEVLAAGPAGIPPEGGLALVRSDPFLQGPTLFSENCSSCHRIDGHDGLGVVPTDDPSASDLAGFGTRAWLTGLLDPERITTVDYFGATEHRTGRMARFVTRGVAGFTPEQREQLTKVIAAVAAEAELPAHREEAASPSDVAEGRALFGDPAVDCANCHTFREYTDGDDDAPVLTGWGSRDWLLGFLHDPTHESYYGDNNDRMPSFGAEEILSAQELGLIVDWLRRDWYEPGVEGR